MGHRWTDDDDMRLVAAVDAGLSAKDNLPRSMAVWWAYVAGRLGFDDVSPDEARTRWERFRVIRFESLDSVIAQFDEYERSIVEIKVDDITAMRGELRQLIEAVADLRTGVGYLVRVSEEKV